MHQGEKHSINFLLNSCGQNQRLENAGGSASYHNGNTVPAYEDDATEQVHEMKKKKTPQRGERGSPKILSPEDSDCRASSFFPATDPVETQISAPTLSAPIPSTPHPRQRGHADHHLRRDGSPSKTESPIPRQQISVWNHKHSGTGCACKKRSRRDFSEFGSDAGDAPWNIHSGTPCPRGAATLPFVHKGVQVPCSLASPFHALSLRLVQDDHSHWSFCCTGALLLEHIYNQSVQSRLSNSQDQCEECREGKGACFGSKRDEELQGRQERYQSSPPHLRQFEQEEPERPLITMYKENNQVKLPATRNKKKRKDNQHSLTFHNLLVNNGGKLSMVEDNNNNPCGGNETIYVNCIFK